MQELRNQCLAAVQELLHAARLEAEDIFVLGCSTSEVGGKKIGTAASPDIARELLMGILPPLQATNVFLAVQCCEHLNRALVVEKEAMQKYGLTRVNALPQPKAGGSAATQAWQLFKDPVLVEGMSCAAAGLDIGNTLIGMHLRPVVVPVRLTVKQIGQAPVVAARTRPKFVGGIRAVYEEELL